MSRSYGVSNEGQQRPRTVTETHDPREIPAARRRLRCPLPVRGENAAIVILLVTAMAGLAWSSSNRYRPAQELNAGNVMGAGTIVGSEMIHIWLPETLRELAGSRSPLEVGRNHEELRRFLERGQQEHVKYAVTLRMHLINGDHADITFVRQPYADPRYTREFLDILAIAGGRRSCGTAADCCETPVHTVPNGLLSREPSDMLAGLRKVLEHER